MDMVGLFWPATAHPPPAGILPLPQAGAQPPQRCGGRAWGADQTWGSWGGHQSTLETREGRFPSLPRPTVEGGGLRSVLGAVPAGGPQSS